MFALTLCSSCYRKHHWQGIASCQRRCAARQVVGLILLAALQRRRRGIHISTMLRPDQVPTGATLRELRAARGTSLDLTSQLEVRAGGRRGARGGCTRRISIHQACL